MNEMTGRVALVTGGGSGIGRATALAFAKNEACVIVAGRREENLLETVALVAASGGESFAVVCDIRDEQSVQDLVRSTIMRYGRLDYAFNNSGVLGEMALLHEVDEVVFRDTFETNVLGTWRCMKHEIRQMLAGQEGGVIVNCGSLSSVLGTRKGTSYNVSKHGVLALTRCGSLDYAERGIRINVVCPGSIETDMLSAFFAAEGDGKSMERAGDFIQGIPAKRFGQPEEVANVVVWLCSPASSFVLGQAIIIDGGVTVL